MSEIIRVHGVQYERYEELLLRKSALRKECFQLEREYTRVFGEDTVSLISTPIVKLLDFEESAMSEKEKWKYCVVGNIVKERIDENGVHRYGTAAFKGGTRVYLGGRGYEDFEPNRKGIIVLGLNRHKRYEDVYTMKSHIENVRLARTYKPKIMALMCEDEGWDGWWGDTEEDKADAERFVTKWPEFQNMTDAGY